MCFPEYEELKEWFKIALPLVGHGIAYWVFYRNNAKSDERQRNEWEFKTKADNDKFYIGKLEAMYGEVLDLTYSFQDLFHLWVTRRQSGLDYYGVTIDIRRLVESKCKLINATISLYFFKDFDSLLAAIYLNSINLLRKMEVFREVTRSQQSDDLESILNEKKHLEQQLEKLSSAIKKKIDGISTLRFS